MFLLTVKILLKSRTVKGNEPERGNHVTRLKKNVMNQILTFSKKAFRYTSLK